MIDDAPRLAPVAELDGRQQRRLLVQIELADPVERALGVHDHRRKIISVRKWAHD